MLTLENAARNATSPRCKNRTHQTERSDLSHSVFSLLRFDALADSLLRGMYWFNDINIMQEASKGAGQ